MSNLQKVAFAKQMFLDEYTNKQIEMVVKLSQSLLSKIKNGRVHNSVSPSGQMTSEQENRKYALDKILSMPEFYSQNSYDDIVYIHVLKFCMVDKRDVRKLYLHFSTGFFNRIWLKKDIDIRKFKSELIDLPYDLYLDLIIDMFVN